MNGLNYPLEQLITIKKKRLDKALKLLEEKKKILDKEKKALISLEKERDEVLKHKKDKLKQLDKLFDEGTTSDKIKQIKTYIKTVDEKLKEKQKKVDAQKKKVEEAKKQLELAKKEFFQRQKDVEKLDIHKKEWKKDINKWIEHQEAIQEDELGSIKFHYKKKEKK